MTVLGEAIWISGVQLALLLFSGYGVTALILPGIARRYCLALAPAVGLGVLGTIGFYATNAGLNLRDTLLIILVLGLTLNAAVVWRSLARRNQQTVSTRQVRTHVRFGTAGAAVVAAVPLLVMTFGCWLLNSWPTLTYGQLGPIGHNWDVEFYLPLAEYLRRYSYATLLNAPANPLRDLVASERIAARAMGGTYVQGLADILAGTHAWRSWVPMLALLRALTIPALYALLRLGLHVGRGGALFGCLLAALHPLLLWTTYNSFGMSLAATTLLPAALLLGILALRDWRYVLGAGLLLGTLACLYWPMLQTYGAAMLGAGLAALWCSTRRSQSARIPALGARTTVDQTAPASPTVAGELASGHSAEFSTRAQPDADAPLGPTALPHQITPGDVILRGVAILLGGAVVGLLAHIRAPAAFLGVFELQTPSMGVTEFLSPAVTLGTLGYSHLGAVGTPTETWLGWFAAAAAMLLLGLGIWRGIPERATALSIAACLLIYLAAIQFVIGFPYGLLRAASYVAPLLAGLIGSGVLGGGGVNDHRPSTIDHRPSSIGQAETHVRTSRTTAPSMVHRPSSDAPVSMVHRPSSDATAPSALRPPSSDNTLRLGSVSLALLVLAASALGAYHTYQPYADRPAVFASELATLGNLQLNTAGLVSISPAETLRGPYLAGWAYALRDHELVGSVVTGYATLENPANGRAAAYGLLAADEDPRADGLDPTQMLWGSPRAALYAAPPQRLRWFDGRQTTLPAEDSVLRRAQQRNGAYQRATPTAPLDLPLAAVDQHATVEVVLTLGSLGNQPIELWINDQSFRYDLPAGVTQLALRGVRLPGTLSIRPGESPVWLRDIAIELDSASGITLQPFDDTQLLILDTQARTGGIETRLEMVNLGGEQYRVGVEVYQDIVGYNATPARLAGTLTRLPDGGRHVLRIDFNGDAWTLDNQPLAVTRGTAGDGRYIAALWLYQGEQVRRVIPLATFTRQGGQASAITPLNNNAAFVRTPEAAVAIDARTAPGIDLARYQTNATSVRAGNDVRVSLVWHARAQPPANPYLVTVQLIDASDRKVAQWDGAAGGDWLPTPAWRPGITVWQDVPLTIAADAPAGTYRLIAALYDPATGQRLPFADGAQSVELTTINIR